MGSSKQDCPLLTVLAAEVSYRRCIICGRWTPCKSLCKGEFVFVNALVVGLFGNPTGDTLESISDWVPLVGARVAFLWYIEKTDATNPPMLRGLRRWRMKALIAYR